MFKKRLWCHCPQQSQKRWERATLFERCFFFGLVCSTEEVERSSESGKWGRWSWSRKEGVAEGQAGNRAGVGWTCDWSSLLRVREITRGFLWGQEQTGMPSGYLCACGTWGTLEGLTLRSRWTWFREGEPPVRELMTRRLRCRGEETLSSSLKLCWLRRWWNWPKAD